jgi:hypothetical protein
MDIAGQLLFEVICICDLYVASLFEGVRGKNTHNLCKRLLSYYCGQLHPGQPYGLLSNVLHHSTTWPMFKPRRRNRYYRDETQAALCKRYKVLWRVWCDPDRPRSGSLYDDLEQTTDVRPMMRGSNYKNDHNIMVKIKHHQRKLSADSCISMAQLSVLTHTHTHLLA